MNVDADPATRGDSLTSQYAAIAQTVCARLSKNERVRRNLPGGGRLRLDRQLPFLCLHRGELETDVSTRELITTEAAYLFASNSLAHRAGLKQLCNAIISTMQEHFGTFLLIEIWENSIATASKPSRLGFTIFAQEADTMPSTIDVLKGSLESIVVDEQSAQVEILTKFPFEAADPKQTLGWSLATNDSESLGMSHSGCCHLGIAVNPIYRDRATAVVYPMVLQRLRWQLATAIRKTVAEFTGSQGAPSQSHYDAFGPSSFVKAVRLIDQQLCEVSESFDYLLQVTPTNSEQAWQGFKQSGFQTLPPLIYRHLPYHPNLLKRRLFAIEIERVEDPTLAYLFWEKQDEIDRQLTSLRDLHLPEVTVGGYLPNSNFLLSSLQLYGAPESDLVELASDILKRFPPSKRRVRQGSQTDEPHGFTKAIGAEELVRFAHEEIDRYHRRMNEFAATVELSDSIASGIMVSQDRLLIANNLAISRSRIAPLLHHEIGTHLLTYFNGRCQPLRQLYAGLAGYEGLQEGLAVLAEYLVGGLTRKRLRMLAGRVLAVHWMVNGKSFSKVFSRLRDTGFPEQQSFTTALRVFRGGGLTKDLIYLRGLRDLLSYLSAGHDIEPLYVGKIGLPHVPYIQELRRRGIITPPRTLPRFWDDTSVRDRLEACRRLSVLDLIES